MAAGVRRRRGAAAAVPDQHVSGAVRWTCAPNEDRIAIARAHRARDLDQAHLVRTKAFDGKPATIHHENDSAQAWTAVRYANLAFGLIDTREHLPPAVVVGWIGQRREDGV